MDRSADNTVRQAPIEIFAYHGRVARKCSVLVRKDLPFLADSPTLGRGEKCYKTRPHFSAYACMHGVVKSGLFHLLNHVQDNARLIESRESVKDSFLSCLQGLCSYEQLHLLSTSTFYTYTRPSLTLTHLTLLPSLYRSAVTDLSH